MYYLIIKRLTNYSSKIMKTFLQLFLSKKKVVCIFKRISLVFASIVVLNNNNNTL